MRSYWVILNGICIDNYKYLILIKKKKINANSLNIKILYTYTLKYYIIWKTNKYTNVAKFKLLLQTYVLMRKEKKNNQG